MTLLARPGSGDDLGASGLAGPASSVDALAREAKKEALELTVDHEGVHLEQRGGAKHLRREDVAAVEAGVRAAYDEHGFTEPLTFVVTASAGARRVG